MAKKKVTTTVEEVETPEVDYNEIHEAKDVTAVIDPDKKVEEPKAPELPVEEKEDKKEDEFDLEKFKQETVDTIKKVSEEGAAKIVEAATGKKEDPKEEDEELISPWKREGRAPKDYEEVSDWALQKKSVLDKRAEVEHQKEVEEQKKVSEETRVQQIENFNKFTDSRLDDLISLGKLPKVINEKDINDPGIVARKSLFQTMLDVNVQREKEGKPAILDIKEIYYEHYTPPKKHVAGADAPVSPASGGSVEEPKEINYNEVHKRSLVDILMNRK